MRNKLLLFVFSAFLFWTCKKNDASVQEAPAPKVITTITGIVTNETGQFLQGVNVTIEDKSVFTDKEGLFLFENIEVPEARYYVKATLNNYFESGFGGIAVKDGVTTVLIKLMSMGTPKDVSATTASTNTIGGATLKFDAGSFVNQNGNPLTSGTVRVYARSLNPGNTNFSELIPGGDLNSTMPDGSPATLESYGMVGVELRDANNNELKLANGKQAEIRFPIASSQLSTAPAEIPLLSMDPESGEWKQEGVATKVGSEYVGKVGHFSWWNCDIPNQNCRIRGRVVDCNNKPISGATVVVNGQYSLITNANGIYERTAPRRPLRFEVRLIGVTQALANTVSLNNPTAGLNSLPDIKVGNIGNCPTYVTGTLSRCGSTKEFSVRAMWGQSTNEGWVPSYLKGDTFRLIVPFNKPIIIRVSSGTLTKDTLVGSLTNGQTLNIGQLSGCVTRPAVRTTTVSNIAATSATSGGEILSNGGAPIIAKGVCWSTSPNANARNANQRTSSGTGTATFTSNLAGLQSNTRYYYRAYAVNNVDTSYGNELNFTTGAASITTLNCAGAVNTGTLTRGVAASGVSSSVPYTGGNGGTYAAFTVQSTGVTGLTASIAAGSFVSANGNLTVTITGTPANGGTASFALNIGGRTCTLTRTVSLPPGTITGLNCAGAVNSGSLNIGNVASGVSSSVPYTGGNGGTYAAFTVQSTGVAGLTASIAAGTFVSGNGNLTVSITGTPSASGTASFLLNIGGRSCTLSRTVSNAIVSVTTNANDQMPSPYMCGGTVTSSVEVIIERGILYGQSQNLDYNTSTLVGSFQYGSSYGGAIPAPATGRITSRSGTGTFSVNIFYLFPGTQFYYCAYAKTASGSIVKGQVLTIANRTYKRSTASPDQANVFWNSQFNLFDLLTDELITPDNNGVYKFFYSSNEDPNVFYKELPASQLPNFLFYKFKTEANCLKWTQIKKGLIQP